MDTKSVVLVVFLIVVVIVLLQGAAVKKIGFGGLSIEFDHGDPGGRQRAHRIAVVFGVLAFLVAGALVFFVGRAALAWASSINFSSFWPDESWATHGPGPVGPYAPSTSKNESIKSTTGTWQTSKGRLTVTVRKVENEGGTLRLHLKATNDSDEVMVLPANYLVASDDTEQTYEAELFGDTWAEQVPAGSSITGIIQLKQNATPASTRLKISFTTVFGFGAPRGSVTVTGIPIPH